MEFTLMMKLSCPLIVNLKKFTFWKIQQQNKKKYKITQLNPYPKTEIFKRNICFYRDLLFISMMKLLSCHQYAFFYLGKSGLS